MDFNPFLPIYRLTITDEGTGVLATALVHDPAHEAAFIAFSAQAPVQLRFSTDEEKHNVTGPLVIPGKHIYRRDSIRGEHYVMFTANEVERLVRDHGKNMRFSNVNIEHASDLVDGAFMIETWITSKNKGPGVGFDLPDGTWMATMHIENEALWQQIKRGERTGFSIEGMFSREKVEMNSQPPAINTPEEFWSFLQDDAITEEKKLEEIDRVISAPQK